MIRVGWTNQTLFDPLIWCAHILLGVGLAAPCMTIEPRMGRHSTLGAWLGLIDDPHTYSILTGIEALLRGDGPWIGAILLLFSVLFPIAKLIALRVAVGEERRGTPRNPTHRLLGKLGKYSMADVFVVALLVVASKSFPGGTRVHLRWGLYAFAAAALLTMLLTCVADRRQNPPERMPDPNRKSPPL